MSNPSYVLSCCSTADLPAAHFAERDIAVAFFHFFLNGKEYDDDLGQSISYPDFYRAMVEGADTRTSQVNVSEYEKHFEKYLSEGKDVLHLCLSTGLSGTYTSATVAAENLRERYPERKLYVLDSLAASSGYGLLMDKLADLRDEGKDIDEVVRFAEENKRHLHHWFFATDLKWFVKGGRISRSAGAVGTLLHICPLLRVDEGGHLLAFSKVRTKKKVILEIVERMKEHAEGGTDYSGKCFLSHSACREDAEAVAALVEATFPKMNGKVEICDIGTTIGSHTGPGTVALFFWGDERQ